MSAGTNQMLREAANPYIDVSDILIRFSMNKQKVERDLSGLNEIEREVYRLIEDGIGNADEIVLRLNLTAVEFNCAITTLELGGYVARLGEAWVSR
jgi:predicted Rossmann fold nucleotide-binding protein DprA/Smf involved in DNA uptake